MDFRARLLATLRRLAPLFEEDGVMVVGSEVPNLLQPGSRVNVEGLEVPVPRPAGLLLEKLATERSGEKGNRDLSLLEPRSAMPDPRPHREFVASLLGRLESQEAAL